MSAKMITSGEATTSVSDPNYALAFFNRTGSGSVARLPPINTNINFPPLEAWGVDHNFKDFFDMKAENNFKTSLHMGNAFAYDQTNAHFAGSGVALKKLLMTPYSAGPMSLVCHKVGNTVYLDLDKEESNVYKQHLYEKELISTFPPSHNALPHFPALSMYENLIWHSKPTEESDKGSGAGLSGTELSLIENPGGLFPRMFHSYSYQIQPQDNLNGQAYLWEFHDSRFLADTDLPIFGGGQFPGVTIRLSEEEKPISVLTGVDLMLDQLMVHVKETIVVYHTRGVVKEYDVVVQDEIPHLTGSEFDPTKLKNITANMYSFLSKNMTEQGHTYWLCRERDSDELKLYDLTALCPELAASSKWNPFLMPVVSLLYKLGSKLMAETKECRSEKVSNVTYGLFTAASKLLVDESLPGYEACIEYFLAGIYLTHGMTPPQQRQTEQDHLLTGLDDIILTSSYARMPAVVKVNDLNQEDNSDDRDFAIANKIPNSGPLADCCDQCLDHCLQALLALEKCHEGESSDAENIIPYVADTLDDKHAFESHKYRTDDVIFGHLRHSILVRAATAYASLSNHAMAVKRYDKLFFHTKAGLQCVASVLSSGPADRHAAVCHTLLPHLLSSFLWTLTQLMIKCPNLESLGQGQYRDNQLQKLALKNIRIKEQYNFAKFWNFQGNVTYNMWLTRIEQLIAKSGTLIADKQPAFNKVEYFAVKDAVIPVDQALCRIANVCLEVAGNFNVSAENNLESFTLDEEHLPERLENCFKDIDNSMKFYALAEEQVSSRTSDDCKVYLAMIILNSCALRRLKYAVLRMKDEDFHYIYAAAQDVLFNYQRAMEILEGKIGILKDGTNMFTRALYDFMFFTMDFTMKEQDNLDVQYPGKRALLLEAALRAHQTLIKTDKNADPSILSAVSRFASMCYLHLLDIKLTEANKLKFGKSPRSKELKKEFYAYLTNGMKHNLTVIKLPVTNQAKQLALRFFEYIDLAQQLELTTDAQRLELVTLGTQLLMTIAKDGPPDFINPVHATLAKVFTSLQNNYRTLLVVDRNNAGLKAAYCATLIKLPTNKHDLYKEAGVALEAALKKLVK